MKRAHPARLDRVYFTPDEGHALTYAAGRGKGSVYEVEPIGPVELDPEYGDTAAAYMSPAARIVRVVDTVTFESYEDRLIALGAYPPADCTCDVCMYGEVVYPTLKSLPAVPSSQLTRCEFKRKVRLVVTREHVLSPLVGKGGDALVAFARRRSAFDQMIVGSAVSS